VAVKAFDVVDDLYASVDGDSGAEVGVPDIYIQAWLDDRVVTKQGLVIRLELKPATGDPAQLTDIGIAFKDAMVLARARNLHITPRAGFRILDK